MTVLRRVHLFCVLLAATLGALAVPAVAPAQPAVTILNSFAGVKDGAAPVAALIQATDGNFYGTTQLAGVASQGTVFKMTPSGTVTVLHVFAGGTDGAQPVAALIQATDGNFYGTTTGGGSSKGTVFRMTPTGTVTVLYAFTGGSDGAQPSAALIQATDGNFYGTTFAGGGSSKGTVFRMTPSGAVTVLYAFTGGADGAQPNAALIQATDGNFYGTTDAGGGSGNSGTVFRMTPSGTLTTLSSLGGNPNGLVQGTDGNFYGTTRAGGTVGLGSIYRMTPSGTVTLLYSFTKGGTGIQPNAGLIQATDGNFYGTTRVTDLTTSGAGGTVFQMTPSGTVTVLHTFTVSGTDGWSPYAALLQASDGNFYGASAFGGVPSGGAGLGVLFKITSGGTFTPLHTFTGAAIGAGPSSLVQATDGNFYGTTQNDGASNQGTAYQMTPSGGVTVLHAFTGGTDGAQPSAALLQATDGNFYGTTQAGGASDNGTVFKMTPSGTVTVLYAFAGGSDGAQPVAALIQATDGNFYGTTQAGGGSGNGGTVFSMTPGGSVTILASLSGSTANPSASLIQATDGNFYGTASGGAVFKVTTGGAVTVLNVIGGNPVAALIQGTDGNFYGTTNKLGSASCGGGSGCGTVFRITPTGTVTFLKNFLNGTDGGFPNAPLIQAADGNFYGTTSQGGGGCGTVFQLTQNSFSTLKAFAAAGTTTDGACPKVGLIQTTGGTLYGTTSRGGSSDGGVVFKVTAAFTPLVTTQPLSQGIARSRTVSLSVAASGSGLTYQWYLGTAGTTTSPIAGATASSYTTPALTSTTSYWVQITNAYGTTNSTTATVVPLAAPGDVDGDGKADLTVFRASSGTWFTLLSSTGFSGPTSTAFGQPGDLPVPGDYDGDGKVDAAVYRPGNGTWYLRLSSTGATAAYQWGFGTEIPVPGDYDGDGRTDLAVYRPATEVWYILTSSSGYTTSTSTQFGLPGDVPVPGDFDGDGITDLAIFKPSTGTWIAKQSGSGVTTLVQFGLLGDIPVPGDYDGDGKMDNAVFRPSNGTWYIRPSSGGALASYQWALPGDTPVPADYDGDGKMDIAVYRPTNGTWYIRTSTTGYAVASAVSYQWGLPGDTATPNVTVARAMIILKRTVANVSRNGDLDGDGRADLTVYRPSSGQWFSLQSGSNLATSTVSQWGLAGDIPVPSDFDGDGQTDLVVFRPSNGTWYISTSSSNFSTSVTYQFGLNGDTPVIGDFDGDGRADPAVFRPSTGTWYFLKSTSNYTQSAGPYQWGLATDIPVPGDYDGDGKTDLAVYRPSTGVWYLELSAAGFSNNDFGVNSRRTAKFQWGLPNDIAVPGDFDGDGKTDLGVFRPSTGTWYIAQLSTSTLGSVPFFSSAPSPSFAGSTAYQWGINGDVPVPGDYDGDGLVDVAVFRPSSGVWYVLNSSAGFSTMTVRQWGLPGDIPILGRQ